MESALSYELNWFKPTEARSVAGALISKGLFVRDGESFVGSRDLAGITVPLGYRPPPDVAQGMETRSATPLVSRILEATVNAGKGESMAKLTSEVEEVSARLGVPQEGAALLVAWRRGVRRDDLITEFESSLSGHKPAK